MAVVLPLLVLFAFGIIDIARLLSADMQLSQAARQGARLAALAATNNLTQSDIQDQVSNDARSTFGIDSDVTVDVSVCDSQSTSVDNASADITYVYRGILFLAAGKTIEQRVVISCGG